MEDNKVKKEVIYIDIDDDITDIINKIIDAKEKVVAIVPPKGVGVLRSPVNLRLLKRASEKHGKIIALVSNSSLLRAMAGSAKVPIAKTLQSKPEIPEIDALEVDGEDIIEGDKLPIEEFDKYKDAPDKIDDVLSGIDIDDNKNFSNKEPVAKAPKGKSAKIPDFSKFRKKLFIVAGGLCVLIVFFAWAIFIAPSATIVIDAKTSALDLKSNVKLSRTATSVGKNEIPVKVETLDKSSDISFDATGTKDVGEAASGSLMLSQSKDSDPVVVKSGTAFSAGNCNFVTTSTVSISGAKLKGGAISAGGASVNVKATSIGEQCNIAPQEYISSISGVSANGGQMSGGSKKQIKIVDGKDVNEAKKKISELKADDIKNELKSKFSDQYIILNDSFTASVGQPEVSPSVGSEAPNGKGSVKAMAKYSISAINKNDIKKYLDNLAKEKIGDESSQKVYDDGSKELSISNYHNSNGVATINIGATAKIGPTINESEVKAKAKGKMYGEVQSMLKNIEGVRNVDVKFSFFWVRKVPNSDDKIKIEFKVDK